MRQIKVADVQFQAIAFVKIYSNLKAHLQTRPQYCVSIWSQGSAYTPMIGSPKYGLSLSDGVAIVAFLHQIKIKMPPRLPNLHNLRRHPQRLLIVEGHHAAKMLMEPEECEGGGCHFVIRHWVVISALRGISSWGASGIAQ